MDITMKVDLRKATRKLRGAEKEQIPFAASQALNDTAFDARKAEMAQMPKKLDRPKPFTVRGFFVQRARKTKLYAILKIPANRAKYMIYQIEGGFRMPGGKVIAVPTSNVPRDKYGNVLKRFRPQNVLATMDAFSGIPNGRSGPAGIWLRGHGTRTGKGKRGGARQTGNVGESANRGESIGLLYVYKPRASYAKRFPFYKIARGVVVNRFPKNMKRRLQQALRSAK